MDEDKKEHDQTTAKIASNREGIAIRVVWDSKSVLRRAKQSPMSELDRAGEVENGGDSKVER